MAGSMGNKKYLSEKNKELPFLETLKNYLDRQDNIHTVLQEGRWSLLKKSTARCKVNNTYPFLQHNTLGYIA